MGKIQYQDFQNRIRLTNGEIEIETLAPLVRLGFESLAEHMDGS